MVKMINGSNASFAAEAKTLGEIIAFKYSINGGGLSTALVAPG